MNATLSKKVALRGLLIAAVTGATMLSIPVPGFRLYFNFGDGIIYLAALLLGPAWGAAPHGERPPGESAAGGIGASLADLLLGYPLWAPFILLIKGAEGCVAGKLGRRSPLLGIAAGAAVMIAGYTTMVGILYGWGAAPVELVTDLVRCGMGSALALAALKPLRKALSRNSGDGR